MGHAAAPLMAAHFLSVHRVNFYDAHPFGGWTPLRPWARFRPGHRWVMGLSLAMAPFYSLSERGITWRENRAASVTPRSSRTFASAESMVALSSSAPSVGWAWTTKRLTTTTATAALRPRGLRATNGDRPIGDRPITPCETCVPVLPLVLPPSRPRSEKPCSGRLVRRIGHQRSRLTFRRFGEGPGRGKCQGVRFAARPCDS
jgi:hypothetical protein